MSSKVLIGLVLLAYSSAAIAIPGEGEGTEEEPVTVASVGMKLKLAYSKEILGGLTQGEFQPITRNGEAIRGLNSIEYLVRKDTPGYQAALQSFQAATDDLIKSAKRQNLDGATLAYTQMTIGCVKCHQLLRDK